MNYVLAIDVGTSFTAAAVVRLEQNAQHVPESLPLGLRGTAVPSVVYYPQEGPILVGEAAERRGLDSPERVVREFKRRVGDSVPICIGTLSLPAEDVFATVARWVADLAEEREGAPPSEIVLSHPASWGGYRTSLILGALATKGLSRVTLITEPEAAALHYASQIRVEDGSTIGVYDLGGGTFDTAVLRKGAAGRFEFLGRPEGIEGLGGADFDAAVFGHVVEHAGAALAAVDPEMPGALPALARLRRECVEAKEALSSDTEASISVLLPGAQQQVRLVRAEFEAMIEGPIRQTVDSLERSLQDVGLSAGDLSAVLLIGGSSRIPLVAQLISQQLDRPIAVDADPKSSICLGAAVAGLRAQLAARQHDVDVHSGAGARTRPGVPDWPAADVAVAEAAGSRPARPKVGLNPDLKARAHGGAHAPRPATRLTTAAAVAALFTVLSATAAQSPPGSGGFTAMFVPPEASAAKEQGPIASTGSSAAGDSPVAVPRSGVDWTAPGTGIGANARRSSDLPFGAAGGTASSSVVEKLSRLGAAPAVGNRGTPPGTVASVPTSLGTGTPVANGVSQAVPGPVAGTVDPATPPQPSNPPTSIPTAEPTPVPAPKPTPVSAPEPTPVPAPKPTPESAPEPTPVPAPEPTTEPTPVPAPEPTTEPTTEPTPLPAPLPVAEPTTTIEPSTGSLTPEATAIPTPTATAPVLLTEPAV